MSQKVSQGCLLQCSYIVNSEQGQQYCCSERRGLLSCSSLGPIRITHQHDTWFTCCTCCTCWHRACACMVCASRLSQSRRRAVRSDGPGRMAVSVMSNRRWLKITPPLNLCSTVIKARLSIIDYRLRVLSDKEHSSRVSGPKTENSSGIVSVQSRAFPKAYLLTLVPCSWRSNRAVKIRLWGAVSYSNYSICPPVIT